MGQEVNLPSAWEGYAKGRLHVYKDGRPFYVFDNARGFSFTLPPGSYKLEGRAMLLGPMKKRKGATVGAPLYPLPSRVELVWCDNPNKCSIDLRAGRIYADHKLKEQPAFVLAFVFFHEVGHYFYRDEARCDEFAARMMHQRGYNPSQIHLASKMTLSCANNARKVKNFITATTLTNG